MRSGIAVVLMFPYILLLYGAALQGLPSQQLGSTKVAQISDAWYKQKAEAIHEQNPRVNSTTLKSDESAVQDAYTKVKEFYSGKDVGQSKEEMLEILGQAWAEYRNQNPEAPLTSDGFANIAEGYGGLRIRSNPPGAAIYVDGKHWTDPTDTEGITLAGKRAIRLSLEGFQDATGIAVVDVGKWAKFYRKMKKK